MNGTNALEMIVEHLMRIKLHKARTWINEKQKRMKGCELHHALKMIKVFILSRVEERGIIFLEHPPRSVH